MRTTLHFFPKANDLPEIELGPLSHAPLPLFPSRLIWNLVPRDPRDSVPSLSSWLEDGDFDVSVDLSLVEDDDPVAVAPPQFSGWSKPNNIYTTKLHTPVFVPLQLHDPWARGPVVAPPAPVVAPKPRVLAKLVDYMASINDNTLSYEVFDSPPRVRLPPKVQYIEPLPNFDTLAMTLTNGELYLEDFCLTFYKRNSHGYMFIREATTLLKVNFTGNKQWVQVKVKLPGICKKTKVNIKNLPMWKPISMNSVVNKRKDKRRRWKRVQLV